MVDREKNEDPGYTFKPCPFCGTGMNHGNAKLCLTGARFNHEAIMCPQCGAAGPWTALGTKDAVDNWNFRSVSSSHMEFDGA